MDIVDQMSKSIIFLERARNFFKSRCYTYKTRLSKPFSPMTQKYQGLLGAHVDIGQFLVIQEDGLTQSRKGLDLGAMCLGAVHKLPYALFAIS